MATPFSLGWSSGASNGEPMHRLHLHMDLEVNLVLKSAVEVIVAGQRHRVEAGHAIAFWGGVPHGLVSSGEPRAMQWITAPMRWLLGLPLPNIRAALMAGNLLHLDPDEGRTVQRWSADLRQPGGEVAVRLEFEALLRRRERQSAPATTPPVHDAVDRMLATLQEHACTPLSIAQVARAAGLSESRAMHRFKAATGATIHQHLAGLRIAHAQRLLLEGRLTGAAVAQACGFASRSSFHAEFLRQTGTTPGRWSAAMSGAG
jgi:AraC-like DNA-binding protein